MIAEQTQPDSLFRYQRQALLPQIGSAGQARLAAARVAIVGCGALGCGVAELLARAGVGHLLIIDRDIVELSNLQRQLLFDEAQAEQGLPKAVAAAKRLRQINRDIIVEPIVADLHPLNARSVLRLSEPGATPDLLIDGTDNAETRYLLNDLAVQEDTPWVYGGCVGVEGRVMAVRPSKSPCLRCVFPDPPAPGALPTCDTSGVLGPLATLIASLQATAAIELLVGSQSQLLRQLTSVNLWEGRFHAAPLHEPDPNCPACGQRRFDFASATKLRPTVLCGRNAIQTYPAAATQLDLKLVAQKLRPVATVELTPYLLRAALADTCVRLTIFPDGRMIAHGTNNPDHARGLYARYIGL